jgi:hypothetical protein
MHFIMPKSDKTSSHWLKISTVICIGLFLQACSTTQEVVVTEEPVVETLVENPAESLGYDYQDYLIKPELAFHSVENSIPEAFQVDVSISQANANSGFRVQIISTQDVRLAEEIRTEFNTWLDQEVSEYNANAYILFRQPYYRLHVGDFKSRANAIEFAQVVKRKFPDAWVVFDTIDPNSITTRTAAN